MRIYSPKLQCRTRVERARRSEHEDSLANDTNEPPELTLKLFPAGGMHANVSTVREVCLVAALCNSTGSVSQLTAACSPSLRVNTIRLVSVHFQSAAPPELEGERHPPADGCSP